MAMSSAAVERALVAALIASPDQHDALPPTFGLDKIADFRAAAAFTAFVNLRTRGATVTADTVFVEIERKAEHKDCRWFEGIAVTVAAKPLPLVLGWVETIAKAAADRDAAIAAGDEQIRAEDELDDLALRDMDRPALPARPWITAPGRLAGELEDRKLIASRALRYHHPFLDDCLRALLPHDLVLIGAPSGIGKTDLALGIAASNAAIGRRVHYFALEAEERELERRTKFSMLSREAYRTKHASASDMNYADWLLGKCEHVCGALNAEIDAAIAKNLGTMWTFYRGASFTAQDLKREILDVHAGTDLILVDHLHYIDSDDENEQKSLGDTVKTIRDVSLRIGKPVILVAHLRKRDQRAKQVISTLDDFHGSSNVVKICTQAVTIERASSVEASKWYLAPTFMTVLKDRRAGAPNVVALTQFDRRTRGYLDTYTLGRLTKGGTEWEQIPQPDAPSWAKHHRAMEAA